MVNRVVDIDERAKGALIRLSVGDFIRLRLGENATTGFRWKVVDDGAPVCVLTGDAVEPGHAAGAAGVRTLQFEAIGRGDGRIELVRGRAWEDEPSKTFSFGVKAS
jgi:inhibitor of cysteine peptidase